MTERTAARLVKLAPAAFLLSMLLPTWLDPGARAWGFQMAYLSVRGSLMGSPLCVLGLLGNVLFIVTSVLALANLAGGRVMGGFALAFKLTILTAGLMVGSWGWLEWIWLAHGETHSWLTPGSLMWMVSAGVLLAGCWRLRIDPIGPRARGFEVIPISPGAAGSVASPNASDRAKADIE